MPRRRPKFQTRLARSDRMRSAAVKQVRAAQPDGGHASDGSRRTVEYVGPTAATDAVIAYSTRKRKRNGFRAVAWLLAIMMVVAIVISVAIVQSGRAATASSTIVQSLLLIGTTTLGLSGLIVLVRWRRNRTVTQRASRVERRLTRTTGTIRVQERLDRDNAREYWLRAPGGDWMETDRTTFEQIEPLLVATQRNDLSFQRRTENDVSQDWALPDATILYHAHPEAGTVVEIHDADGELVYRHPHYSPDE